MKFQRKIKQTFVVNKKIFEILLNFKQYDNKISKKKNKKNINFCQAIKNESRGCFGMN